MNYDKAIILLVVLLDGLCDVDPVADYNVGGINQLIELQHCELDALMVGGLRCDQSVGWKLYEGCVLWVMETVKLLKAFSQASFDHVALGCLDHAEGASCAD